jgi:hypothetical protein
MSRGLGKVEREVLALFGAGELLNSATVACRVFGSGAPTAAAHSSVCRALRSLTTKGLVDADGMRRWGTLKAVQKARGRRLRLNATHSLEERGNDAYFTHPVAVHSLICLERQYLPRRVLEPAAGEGAIVNVLCGYGYTVTASDIVDYGLDGCEKLDYLTSAPAADIDAVVTNPPYAQAVAFIRKALSEGPYVAMLLRTNFLESAERESFFAEHPFARMWVASLRLPMMHRRGWTGKRVGSNVAYAWYVWDRAANEKMTVGHFNWKKLDFDWRKVVAEASAAGQTAHRDSPQ